MIPASDRPEVTSFHKYVPSEQVPRLVSQAKTSVLNRGPARRRKYVACVWQPTTRLNTAAHMADYSGTKAWLPHSSPALSLTHQSYESAFPPPRVRLSSQWESCCAQNEPASNQDCLL